MTDRHDSVTLTGKIDYLLGPVLSARRPAKPLAEALSRQERAKQDFILHWIEVIDRSNYELAYQFAAAATGPAASWTCDDMTPWILAAMDAYDRDGLYAGIAVLREVDAYRASRGAAHAATLSDRMPALARYARGLSGRELAIAAGPVASTDTETLFLPARIDLLASKKENINIFNALSSILIRQIAEGPALARALDACQQRTDPDAAARRLAYLETIRLGAAVGRYYPGLARHLTAISNAGVDTDVRFDRLRKPDATVLDSLTMLDSLQDIDELPPLPLQIKFHPEANSVRNARIERQRSELAAFLASLIPEQTDMTPRRDAVEHQFTLNELATAGAPDQRQFELRRNGEAIELPAPVQELMQSIRQDLGHIPEAYLRGDHSAENTGGQPGDDIGQNNDSGDAPTDDTSGNRYCYDEWDFRRSHYRKQWCELREIDVQAGPAEFVRDTLSRHAAHIRHLRRTFEMLRDEDRMLRRQTDGDDIDYDALIEGYCDLRCGRELPERLLARRHRAGRDLAALLMVDMSGSTKGWINDAEREALILLCEALETLGDRYAIFGFSGLTRKRCEIYRIKQFDEPYDRTVRERIAGIAPQDYTRMGAAIRHLTGKLAAVDARTRLLITLSDGKPDDYSDSYRGEYGIEDTRKALIEARHAGIQPFCITIDQEARDYLPHMYGKNSWALISDAAQLPLKMASLYKQLTAR